MHTLSMEQALSLWTDLEQAYHKTNHYGGDTAEIYISRLMPYSSLVAKGLACNSDPGELVTEETRAALDKANKALYALLEHFATTRGAIILVENRILGPWLCTARYGHRVHVKVSPK